MTPPSSDSPAPDATPEGVADSAAHVRQVTDRHIRNEKLKKLARRDPLTRELVEQVSAGEQAAADLVTAKATIASLETQLAAAQARVTELETQLSGKKK